MFERLGEIVDSGERYKEGHGGCDEPEVRDHGFNFCTYLEVRCSVKLE
jgi:hypothetical protein